MGYWKEWDTGMMALEQDDKLGGVYWLLLICDVNEAAI